jgi:hypothetical protein
MVWIMRVPLGLYENFTGTVKTMPKSEGGPDEVTIRALNSEFKATIQVPHGCMLNMGDRVNVMGQTPTTPEGDLILSAAVPQIVISSGACVICPLHYPRAEGNSPLCAASSSILNPEEVQPVIVEHVEA